MIISKCFCDRCGKQIRYRYERFQVQFFDSQECHESNCDVDLCKECYEIAQTILSTAKEDRLRQERIEEMNQEDENE